MIIGKGSTTEPLTPAEAQLLLAAACDPLQRKGICARVGEENPARERPESRIDRRSCVRRSHGVDLLVPSLRPAYHLPLIR